MNIQNQAELSRVLDLDRNALLAELGASLVGPMAVPMPKHEAVRRAKAWLHEQKSALMARVCSSREIQELANAGGSRSNRSDLVVAVADLLMTITGNVPVFTVASLLVKEDLTLMCASYWGCNAGTREEPM